MRSLILKLGLVGVFFIMSEINAHAQVIIVRPREHVEIEVRPARPGSGYYWQPGQWEWRGREYIWVPGFWVVRERGHIWRRGHWRRMRGGYMWVPGHWR
jgi:hypothetical protein